MINRLKCIILNIREIYESIVHIFTIYKYYFAIDSITDKVAPLSRSWKQFHNIPPHDITAELKRRN